MSFCVGILGNQVFVSVPTFGIEIEMLSLELAALLVKHALFSRSALATNISSSASESTFL